MHYYCSSLTEYRRLPTREVRVGDLVLGHDFPIRIQTMTTTDTLDTRATVEQCIRCFQAGAELVRITAPSRKEAENLREIKKELRRRGYSQPLVADIHFTPNAAEIAARIVEKVRINPGNYADKKKFELLEYNDRSYESEIQRIRDRFMPLIAICKEYGTALRIGANHGSLSDRIMSRYGDTPMGMVESAMEFLRIARTEHFHQIVLSMKSSNPRVMVQAYRLLVGQMMEEFGECYPLHLGVTEAGDGEDGRIKSAVGTGTLLEDGIGDTIRVSLTEDPEFELPVCRALLQHLEPALQAGTVHALPPLDRIPYDPYSYSRRPTKETGTTGGIRVPVVIADASGWGRILPESLDSIGYHYDPASDKWNLGEAAADFLYCPAEQPDFPLPGSLQLICDYPVWKEARRRERLIPLLSREQYLGGIPASAEMHLILLPVYEELNEDFWYEELFRRLTLDPGALLCLQTSRARPMTALRRFIAELMLRGIQNPVILRLEASLADPLAGLVDYSISAGALLCDGMGDGLWLLDRNREAGRDPDPAATNLLAFGILQATRNRISRTDYISCPSCGRTLFDLQETTARIRAVTHHLKGVKIAIMGCIVNGPGEMADADFGYVGSGTDKITLYRGKEIVKRGLSSEAAVEELINLIRDSGLWVEAGSGKPERTLSPG